MKVSLNVSALQKMLNISSPSVAKKSPLVILSNILLEWKNNYLILTTTDLNTKITCNCAAKLEGKAATTVSHNRFQSIVKQLPPDKKVNLKLTDKYLQIKCGKATYKLLVAEPKDFPSLPVAPDKLIRKINCLSFLKAIEQTSYAMCTERRPQLEGLLIEIGKAKVCVIGCDGHRLAISKFNRKDDPITFFLPNRAVQVITAFLKSVEDEELAMEIGEGWLYLSSEESTCSLKLSDMEPLDYKPILKEHIGDDVFPINRTELLGSLRRLAVLEGGEVVVSIKKDLLSLSSSSFDCGDGQEQINIESSIKEFDSFYSCAYMIEMLNAIPSEELFVKVKAAQKHRSSLSVFAAKDNEFGMVMAIQK